MVEMTAAESKKLQIHQKTMVYTFHSAVKLKNQQWLENCHQLYTKVITKYKLFPQEFWHVSVCIGHFQGNLYMWDEIADG